jgi:hypothetical protein
MSNNRWNRTEARLRHDVHRAAASKRPLTARNIRRLIRRLSPETAAEHKDLIDGALAKARGEPDTAPR